MERSKAFVTQVTEGALASMGEPGISADEQRERLKAVLEDALAIRGIAFFVLGRYRRDASEAELLEFLQLFEEVTVGNFARQFNLFFTGQRFVIYDAFARNSPNPKRQVAFVRTRLGLGAEAVLVDWEVTTQNDIFKITDVVAEGVSLVQAAQADMGGILSRNGGNVTALNEKLRAQRDRR